MTDKAYIVVGNDGLPRFADPECSRLYVAKSYEAALDTAQDMVEQNPGVIFSIYAREASVFYDGLRARVVREHEAKD